MFFTFWPLTLTFCIFRPQIRIPREQTVYIATWECPKSENFKFPKILISKFWSLGEGFRGFGPQIRRWHAEISPGTNSEPIWLELKGFPRYRCFGS